MDSKSIKELNLGLDIGTNSVGWALLDEKNKLIKKNGFTFWGVRMFDEAKDAKSTRTFRNTRRRLRRRRNRIIMLQEIFSKELNIVDPNFIMKLEDSFYQHDDKRNKEIYDGSYGLFKYDPKETKQNEAGYIFYKGCPTVFHLRKYLLDSNKKEDIRLVYLAMHNLIKYRGNFLVPGDEFNDNDITSLIQIFNDYNDMNNNMINDNEDAELFDSDYFECIEKEFNEDFFNDIGEILSNKSYNKKMKQVELLKLFNAQSNTLTKEYLIPLLVGSKVDIAKLKILKQFKYEKSEIDLSKENLEEEIEKISSNIPGFEELFLFSIQIKNIVDYYYLKRLLKGKKYLCEAMIEKYNEHHEDLESLKGIIKKYLPKSYWNIFREHTDKLNNYVAYIGRNNIKNKTERFCHANRNDFYKFIKPILESILKINNVDLLDLEKINLFLLKIENNDFLLRQDSDQNGSFPMQLNLKELKLILDKQKKFYPFLNDLIDGITNIEKIVSIFKFKIPYYLGPLTTDHNKSTNSWLIKNVGKENISIKPWNINEVVDKAKTAEKFINRMQNKCTYLKGDNDYCLPKKSMIFSEYNCLSYLNKIKINGSFLSKEIKDDVFVNYFKKTLKPTKRNLIEYLRVNHGELVVSTTNGKELQEITCDMSSYIELTKILGEDIVTKHFLECEEIIKFMTLFEDKDILEVKLLNYNFLTTNSIKKLKGLSYSKWSSLCKNLIDGDISYQEIDESGEIKRKTILQIMRETNLNLMEIINSDIYKIGTKIDEYNSQFTNEENTLEEYMDNNIVLNPIMHRPLTQALSIIREIESIMGRKIDNYYIECDRTNKAEKKVTKSRYESLKELYASCEKLVVDFHELQEELNENKDNLKSDKLFLYFTQLGRSAYTNKKISLSDVILGNGYDIDHIYPQSLIKDDSLSNRVLVEKEFNNLKKDLFLFEVPAININNMKNNLWNLLLDKGLISKEKYRRLNKMDMDSEELAGFVNRQIVSTNQSEKALVDILKNYKGVKAENIIFSKAENISAFRKENGLVKSRTANNYHHAHDAYLNVVVGGALDKYYRRIGVKTFEDYDKIKSLGLSLNPTKILRWNRSTCGNIIRDLDKYIVSSQQSSNFNLLWNCDLELGKGEMIQKIERIIDEDTGEVELKYVPSHSYFPDASEDNGRIYYDLFKRFDVSETRKMYNESNMFSKVTISPKGKGCVMLKSSDNNPRNSIEKYGGYKSPNYSRFVIVKFINSKNKVENKLVAISRMNDDTNEDIAKDKILSFIKKNHKFSKYKSFEIINYNIKKNCIIKFGKKLAYITGVTEDSFLLLNKIDRNFNYESLVIIKKLDKYSDQILNKINMRMKNENEVVLAEAKNELNKEITLSKDELKIIIQAQLLNFRKNIYSYSNYSNLKEYTVNDFYKFSFSEMAFLANQLLRLLKTNERALVDLSLLGLAKNYGTLRFTVLEKCQLLSQSITGYYTKVLFEAE